MTEKPFLWVRVGWAEYIRRRGASLEDIGATMVEALSAVAAGDPVPKDKWGAWQFFSVTEPGKDH